MRRRLEGWVMPGRTSRESLALLVPSAIIAVEFNVLLNPVHPSYTNVIWSAPEPFRFDQRLLRTSVHE